MTWQDYYKLFEIIVNDYFPDEELIEEHVKTLHYIFQNQPEMQAAYKRWEEYSDDEEQ